MEKGTSTPFFVLPIALFISLVPLILNGQDTAKGSSAGKGPTDKSPAYSVSADSNPAEDEGDGTITFIKGMCSIKDEKEVFRPAKVDQIVHSGDTIKTDRTSEAEVTLRDGSTLFITEDTEITIHQSAVRESRYTSIGLLLGSIRLIVNRLKPGGQFSINTVSATAGVRGTRFDAAVREDGAVLVTVEEGLVETEFQDQTHEIQGGSASIFYLTGEREDLKQGVESKAWREEALKKIRENPGLYVQKLLERERKIIAVLKEQSSRVDEYRREWAEFIRKAQYLESKGLHDQEKKLILLQIERTKRGLLFLMGARKNLTVVRSILLIAFRIEDQIGSEGAKKLPSFEEIRREYAKIGHVIARLQDAEAKLKRVLFILNKKYQQLESRSCGGRTVQRRHVDEVDPLVPSGRPYMG